MIFCPGIRNHRYHLRGKTATTDALLPHRRGILARDERFCDDFASNNSLGTEVGICQGARWPEYGSWFERAHNFVFNPGTSKPLAVSLWFEPSSPYGFQALFSKSGEYELILQTGKLVLRVASNTGGGSWDKEVEVSHSIISGWHHALFWIEPGVEIGLCLDGGTPETEGLAAGQAARVINGGVFIGYPPPPEPSSSWHWSSSYYPSSSSAMVAELFSTPSPYVGLVDEIAVFNEALNAGWRSALYGGGSGLFWHADHDDWGPCQWSSSSWHWSSSYYYSSSYYSSWAMRGEEGSSESGKSVNPVTSGLLALASDGDPDRVLTQYVWGARPGHRDELVLRDRASIGSGELDERLYCLMDYFDPTSAVDTEGEVVERYGFSAFGVRNVMAPDWSSRTESWVAWEFGFHGQLLDGETGYYNYGFRYYIPRLGRWVNSDPIGEEGGVNIYAIANNGLINTLDYLGLTWHNHPGAKDPAACDSFAESYCKNINRKVSSAIWSWSKSFYGIYSSQCSVRCTECTIARVEELQADKNKLCNVPRRCNCNQTSTEIEERIQAGTLCIRARLKLMRECFHGGDAVHKNEVKEAEKVKTKCINELSKKGPF